MNFTNSAGTIVLEKSAWIAKFLKWHLPSQHCNLIRTLCVYVYYTKIFMCTSEMQRCCIEVKKKHTQKWYPNLITIGYMYNADNPCKQRKALLYFILFYEINKEVTKTSIVFLHLFVTLKYHIIQKSTPYLTTKPKLPNSRVAIRPEKVGLSWIWACVPTPWLNF